MKALRSYLYRLAVFVGVMDIDWALVMEAEKGSTDTVKILLDAGADVHACGDEAILVAAENGNFDTVKMLLEAGADVHAERNGALRLAEENGHADTLVVLKQWTAQREQRDKEQPPKRIRLVRANEG